MKELLFPWESQVMINHPWAMPVFMLMLAIALSLLTEIIKLLSKWSK